MFSKGFICPKGSTLKQLHEDPDRLRKPLIKRDGKHVEVSWAEAWTEVHQGLTGVIERHGRESIATYLGNPNAHNLSGLLYNRVWLRSLGTRQIFSASTVDQIPKQVSSGFLFGTPVTVAVPDLDRTSYLLMLGANRTSRTAACVLLLTFRAVWKRFVRVAEKWWWSIRR